MLVDEPVDVLLQIRKRKADDAEIDEMRSKRMKLSSIPEEKEDDDILVL